MVWGGICIDGRIDLYIYRKRTLTALRYRDKFLDSVVRPFACATSLNFILMQDNARPHTARVAIMEWSTRSPDLNPIENLLGHPVQARQ